MNTMENMAEHVIPFSRFFPICNALYSPNSN